MDVFNFKLDDRPDDRFEASPLCLFIESLTMGESRAYDGFGRGIRSQAKAPHRALSMAARRAVSARHLCAVSARHPLAVSACHLLAPAWIVYHSVEEMYASNAPKAR